MNTNATDVISCTSVRDIVSERNRVIRLLSPVDQQRLSRIFTAYLNSYGIEGVFQRMNGRSVSTIFNEFSESDEPQPIESGELNGIRYSLYETPNDPQS